MVEEKSRRKTPCHLVVILLCHLSLGTVLPMKEQQGTLGRRLWAGILLWVLKKEDAPFKWQWHKRLGALTSQESSTTFKTPAASSPTIVNRVAVYCDLSVVTRLSCSQDPLWQLLFSSGSRWARQLEEAGEERWKKD